MTTNQQLLELYTQKMETLKPVLYEYNSSNSDKATNPLLLQASEKWDNADIKIMIIGQDTNEWCGECGTNGQKSIFSANIEKSLQVYRQFYFEKNGGRSPFWNEFRRIKRSVQTSKTVDFAWNNVIKIGRIGKGNVPAINDITKNSFDVLKEEINILKPNILIFFTGPHYDHHVKKFIGDFTTEKIQGFEENTLSKINFKDFNFDLCLKTYHPNYLYRSGQRKFVMDELIRLVNEEIN